MKRKIKKRRKIWRWILILLLMIILALAGLYYVLKINKQEPEVSKKNPVAYIEYMGLYLTFDEDGMVLQSYSAPPEEIPNVMGLEFEYVVVNEYLPIKDQELFELCVFVSEYLSDTNMVIDRIWLDEKKEIYLLSGEIIVEMGKKKDLEKKLIHLKRFSDSLIKHSAGVLDMKQYNEKGEYTFTSKN